MEITMHDLLKRAVDLDASDLHLTTHVPPRVRVNGALKSLDCEELTASDGALRLEVQYDRDLSG